MRDWNEIDIDDKTLQKMYLMTLGKHHDPKPGRKTPSRMLYEGGISIGERDGKLVARERLGHKFETDEVDPNAVIGFHVHPFDLPTPSRGDIRALLENENEQLTIVGGGDGRHKKLYCVKKPKKWQKRLTYSERNEILSKIPFSNNDFYPFEMEASGETINELENKDFVKVVERETGRSFEMLKPSLAKISAEAKLKAIEDAGFDVRRYNFTDDGKIKQETGDSTARMQAMHLVKRINRKPGDE